jgi:hypothetical protein
MAGSPNEWLSLIDEFVRLASRIDRTKSVNLNAADLRAAVQSLAERYFQATRPFLQAHGLENGSAELDAPFSALLKLSHAPNAIASYKKHVKAVRKLIPGMTAELAKAPRNTMPGQISPDEVKLLGTLRDIVPSAALSYRQAITDLHDATRVSFRGPALELREALREVLDHLAPDEDVIASPGYRPEKDQNGKERTSPTMKQKARFILKARGTGRTAGAAPEDAVNSVDAIVASVTRSVYELSSVATHVSTERAQVIRAKRYVEAVLHDLLEIT